MAGNGIMGEGRVERLLSRVPVVPWEASPTTFDFTWVGPQAPALLGYPVESWYAPRFWQDHLHPEDREEAISNCMACLDRDPPSYTFEYRMIAVDGRSVWIEDIIWVEKVDGRPVTITGYMIDVTRRKVLEEARAALAGRLEQSLAAMATLSHELGTPLSVLGLQVELLAKHREGDAELGRAAETMARAIHQMQNLTSTLLDVYLLTEGRTSLNLADVDLADVARAVTQSAAGELARRGARIQLVVPARAVIGRWDRMRLEQIVQNLLSNAIKYGEGKLIEVVVDAREGVARLEVIDRGIGITEAERGRIFDRFARTPEARRSQPGAGLGLWIVRQVCEAMAGSISVAPTPGGGSTFTVQLPMVAPG